MEKPRGKQLRGFFSARKIKIF
jgi:hypothetical protein